MCANDAVAIQKNIDNEECLKTYIRRVSSIFENERYLLHNRGYLDTFISDESKEKWNNLLLVNTNVDSVSVSEEKSEQYYPKKKSVALSIILSTVLPINGLGHFYAGKYLTGFILLGIELGSVLYALRDGSVEVNETEGVIFFVGYSGTYLYDVIGASLAVQKYNFDIEEKQSKTIVPYVTVIDNNRYYGLNLKF